MRVCKEILSTEESYVHSLNLMLALGLFPLREAARTPDRMIISEQEIRVLFSSIEVLIPLHQVFLEALKPKIQTFNVDTVIGDSLEEITKFARLYTDYINNFDESRDLLTSLTTGAKVNKKFVNFIQVHRVERSLLILSFLTILFHFLQNFHEHPDTIPVGDLASFLIMPIQRTLRHYLRSTFVAIRLIEVVLLREGIPRYCLLIESLIAATPITHRDLPLLTASVKKIKQIADYINDRKRMREQSNEVLRVYNLLTPPVEDLVQPGRHLLLEGSLTQLNIQNPSAIQEASYPDPLGFFYPAFCVALPLTRLDSQLLFLVR